MRVRESRRTAGRGRVRPRPWVTRPRPRPWRRRKIRLKPNTMVDVISFVFVCCLLRSFFFSRGCPKVFERDQAKARFLSYRSISIILWNRGSCSGVLRNAAL